jgi:membrane associated rhomboid family serine protease
MNILMDIKRIKSGRKELKEFGLTIGVILSILGAIAFWRGKGSYPYLLASAAVFALSGALLPQVLKPLQKTWMTVSVILGFFVTGALLIFVFYAVITPVGLIARMFGKNIMDEYMDKGAESYWVERPVAPKNGTTGYENQY